MKKIIKNFEELIELINDNRSVCLLDLNLEFDIFEFCSGEYKENDFIIKTFGINQDNDNVLMIETAENEPYLVRNQEYATDVINSWLVEWNETTF